jgi:hypothetical protein
MDSSTTASLDEEMNSLFLSFDIGMVEPGTASHVAAAGIVVSPMATARKSQ